MAYQCSATTMQNTHLEIPTDIHALEALAELSFNISCQLQHQPLTFPVGHQIWFRVQPFLQQEVAQSPVSPEQDAKHFCCYCHPAQKASHALCTSCSSAAAALLVWQEESFSMAAADRWAHKLPLPPLTPSPMALQHAGGTTPVIRKSSGVKHPARINPI